MLRKIIGFTALCMALLSAVVTAADDQPLQPGSYAPDFTLKDAEGKEHTLSEKLKESKVALVFYRSGAW